MQKNFSLKILLTLLMSCMIVGSTLSVNATQLITQTHRETRETNPPPNIPNLAIDQQQITNSGASYMAVCDASPWQSFVPSQNTLSTVAIYIAAWNLHYTSDLTMHIRTSPDSPDLTSVTVSQDEIPTANTWIVFDVPDISVTPGNTYYIVMTGNGEAIARYGWSSQREYDAYPLGEACISPAQDWEFATYYPMFVGPAVDVLVNGTQFVASNTVTIKVKVTNGPTPVTADVIVWVSLPDGTIIRLLDLTGVTIPANMNQAFTIFSYHFTANDPVGLYDAGAVLIYHPGGIVSDVELFTKQ
ncbi:MAG: hypothetical protein ABIF11_08315 [Nitrospirota bacterium]